MVSDGEKLKQMKIYYLFMHADGESSLPEKHYLDDILAKSDLPTESAREFQAYCKQTASVLSAETSKSVIEKIDGILGEKSTRPRGLSFFETLDCDKILQAQTIWTLINLGYADSEYSEAEKRVVDHLVQRWSLDPVLVAEFNDTADTILALTLQKEWVRKTARPSADIDLMIQELDQNIASMLVNVEISISEADIA